MSTNTYPTIRQVIALMEADQGEGFKAPAIEPTADWDVIEPVLAKLSQEDLETIAVGSEEDMPAVYAKLDNAEDVHGFLDELFMLVGMES